MDSSHAQYLDALEKELELAAARGLPQADTVFIGGGTPSLLGADGLGRILTAIRNTFGLTANAEVTTESNPESTSPDYFAGLLDAGFTRVSLGMQSASTPVLKVLDRLDMIYGTPTETDDDVRRTLDAILATDVDHVSAYSLIVEDGTAMSRKIRRGELPAPKEDVYADRYEIIADTLAAHDYDWYEVSNWAKPGGQCRHNLIYWRNQQWWGAGPGAHSFIGAERFFNVKRPEKYAQLLASATLPIQDRETITDEEAHTEAVMLGLRLKEGIPAAWVGAGAQDVVDRHVRAGLLEHSDRLRLTDSGRLLADGIITDILAAE